MQAHYQRLAQYETWADQTMLQTILGGACETDERVIHLLGHLASAKRVWLNRLAGRSNAGVELWPKPPASEAGRQIAQADAELVALASAPQLNLERVVTYQTFSQQTQSDRVCDILTHLVNHGTYHRGQIATAVKNAGGTPALTDYIVWVRREGQQKG